MRISSLQTSRVMQIIRHLSENVLDLGSSPHTPRCPSGDGDGLSARRQQDMGPMRFDMGLLAGTWLVHVSFSSNF